jgi:hypothetical protein
MVSFLTFAGLNHVSNNRRISPYHGIVWKLTDRRTLTIMLVAKFVVRIERFRLLWGSFRASPSLISACWKELRTRVQDPQFWKPVATDFKVPVLVDNVFLTPLAPHCRNLGMLD